MRTGVSVRPNAKKAKGHPGRSVAVRGFAVLLAVIALTGAGAAQVPLQTLDNEVQSETLGELEFANVAVPPAWLGAGYHMAPAQPWTPMNAEGPLDPAGSENVEFRCPEGPYGDLPLPSDVPGPTPTGATQDTIVVYGCPIRIIDQDDAFGNPQMVVQHDDHRNVAFATLHGAASNGGPSEYSRAGQQTQTLFTSGDQGISWEDQPVQNFRVGMGGRYGESASTVIDDDGNVYVAYLWAEGAGDTWDPFMMVFKGGLAGEPGGFTRAGGAYDHGHRLGIGGQYHSGRDNYNNISRVDLLHLPSFAPVLDVDSRPPANATNGAQAATTEDQDGELTYDEANRTEARVVAVWHEATRDPANSALRKSGWIDAAWTHTGPGNTDGDWDRLAPSEAIGPCRNASNPAHFEDKVYVACVVDAGYGFYYPERSRARIGDIDIWSIDVFTGNTTYESTVAGLVGGRVFLDITEDGYMGVINYKEAHDEDGNYTGIEMGAAYKWHSSKSWGRFSGGPMGTFLRQMGGGAEQPIVDADITAFQLTNDQKTSVIVYKERKDVDSATEPSPPDGTGTADDPLVIIDDVFTEYDKYFVAFDQCNFPLASFRMELGHGVDSYNAAQYQENPATFNDVNDGLFLTRETSGEELLYFAISDYGAMQYGAIVTNSIGAPCPIGFPPPVVPPVPVPQALTIFNPVNMALGATMAVPAVVMVTYLLRQKSKAPSYITAGDE